MIHVSNTDVSNTTISTPENLRSVAAVSRLQKRRPFGYVLIFTLGALACISGALFSILPSVLQSRRHIRSETLRVQGEYLVRGILQKTLDQLASNADYAGEAIDLSLPNPPSLPQQTTSAEQAIGTTHPDAQPTDQNIPSRGANSSHQGPNYRAIGNITIDGKQLTISLKLRPESVAEHSPTSAQPHVTIKRTWQLPDGEANNQTETTSPASTEQP